MADILFACSLLALIVTKVADLVTTVRHVGPEAERNPLARRWIARFGFRRGLAAVALVWIAVVAVAYAPVWSWGGWAPRLATASVGFLIAWVQWDAARFNATGRATRFTRAMLRVYRRW